MFANTKIRLIAGVLILAAGAMIVAKTVIPKNAPPPAAAMNDQTADTVNGVGTLEAKEIVVLAPKTASRIQEVYADEGDRVRAGQVVAKMEIAELGGYLGESAAALAKSRSQLVAAKASIEDLEAKKSLADATLSRYQELSKGGFVTAAELDAAAAGARSAGAQLTAARENLKLSAHEIEKSESALVAQRAKIDDLTLRSPFEGIVVSRNAEAGSTVSAATAVFRIANPKSVWVKVYIDERQSGAVKLSQRAVVTLRSMGEKRFSAEVARIGVESDRITEERVVYLRLLDDPEFLHLGEQAEAQIHIRGGTPL